MPSRPLRVVLAPSGTRGDVQPTIALAHGLRERGHDVLLVASHAFEPLARQWSVPFVGAGCDVEAWTKAEAKMVARHPLNLARALNQMLVGEIGTQFEALIGAARGADVIVGAGLQFAGPSIAEALAVPYRYLVYAPQILETDEHPAPLIPWLRAPRLVNRLSWWVFRTPSSCRCPRAAGRSPSSPGP